MQHEADYFKGNHVMNCCAPIGVPETAAPEPGIMLDVLWSYLQYHRSGFKYADSIFYVISDYVLTDWKIANHGNESDSLFTLTCSN